ncbi:hypothetical protein AVEN_138493-1 [Araneus ventricosus]|uniref:Uncharacterized protein n=1 Tax=Araneus ventricosus TaxID=182803 RepID=A0A4Y2CGD7_ARAVE|nr:hypothetical protein AVEN_138493-1 [Araneus ventricosus]
MHPHLILTLFRLRDATRRKNQHNSSQCHYGAPSPSEWVMGSRRAAGLRERSFRTTSFKNCGIKEITDWLNSDMEDAGFQLLNDEEIITEVQKKTKKKKMMMKARMIPK